MRSEIWRYVKKRTGSSNPSITCVHCQQTINTQRGVFIVGFNRLGDFPLIALVGAWAVVRECFWARELVVRGWRCDDVALGCDLACEAGDGAGH
jgi:hypothetical protein